MSVSMQLLAPFRRSTVTARILEAVGDLPTSARLLPRLQKLLRDPETSTAELLDLLRLDATLTARAIALANRAFFTGGRHCTTLDEAVGRLGFEEVYQLVATVAVDGVFNQEMALYGMPEGALMDESVTVAVLLPLLNRDCRLAVRGDELFTVGLLHALGKLGLTIYAQKNGETRRIPRGHPSAVMSAERRLFRVTHPEVAAAMMENWSFAEDLVRIVRFQAAPRLAGAEAPCAHLLAAGLTLAPFVLDPRANAEDARRRPEIEAIGIDDRKIPALVARAREVCELFVA